MMHVSNLMLPVCMMSRCPISDTRLASSTADTCSAKTRMQLNVSESSHRNSFILNAFLDRTNASVDSNDRRREPITRFGDTQM